jgi:hypothetical protein
MKTNKPNIDWVLIIWISYLIFVLGVGVFMLYSIHWFLN